MGDLRVLYVGETETASRLETESSFQVVVETVADAGLERLSQAIDCIVVEETLPDGGCQTILDAVDTGDVSVPVILLLAKDGRTPGEAIEAGAAEVVSAAEATDPIPRLRHRIHNAVSRAASEEETPDEYEAITETMPIAFIMLDENGRVVSLNDQLVQTFDAITKDWCNRRFVDLIQADRVPGPITVEYIGQVQEALAEGMSAESVESTPAGVKVFSDEVWVEAGNERSCYDVQISHIDIDRSVDVGGYMILLRDITQKKEREEKLRERETELEQQKTDLQRQTSQLEYQNERLDKFARIVSHDLRNPLNVAQGRLELLEDTIEAQSDSGTELDHISNIQHSLGRMEDIIEDALTMTRMGKAITETKEIRLDETVATAWSNVETETATLENCDPVEIDSNADRLLNVFENLFRNSVEHGGTDITVRVGLLQDGFFVEDDGPGIDDDMKEDVFEEGVTTASEGTGLGLAIVRDVVRAHGWDISLTETVEGGTRFEISGVTFSYTIDDIVTLLAESLGNKKARDITSTAMAEAEIGRARFDRKMAEMILNRIAQRDDVSSLTQVAAKTTKRKL